MVGAATKSRRAATGNVMSGAPTHSTLPPGCSYMSPELFLHDDVSPALDIYSFGIIRECLRSLHLPAPTFWHVHVLQLVKADALLLRLPLFCLPTMAFAEGVWLRPFSFLNMQCIHIPPPTRSSLACSAHHVHGQGPLPGHGGPRHHPCKGEAAGEQQEARGRPEQWHMGLRPCSVAAACGDAAALGQYAHLTCSCCHAAAPCRCEPRASQRQLACPTWRACPASCSSLYGTAQHTTGASAQPLGRWLSGWKACWLRSD